MAPQFSSANLQNRLTEDGATVTQQTKRLGDSVSKNGQRIMQTHGERAQTWWDAYARLSHQWLNALSNGQAAKEVQGYAVDAMQRGVLTLDTLRQRGDNDQAHEANGTPPVLIYDYEVVMDGRSMPRPTNYQLLKILPPKGCKVLDWKRPYMIIDPRAGHGAGIGGFKPDSQVGVALRDGHPVYFVVFRQHPEPDQTLADVMRSEVEFVHEIVRRHPKAPKPIIVGNCQGGWATMVLAATNPEIAGPLVINGAPMAYWSGELGESPMRYNGGLLGGAVPALMFSDLGHGEFDGAHLVSNFEMLNPGRNFFGKYYDLFANPEKSRDSFLEFERWWGGFHFTNEAEIRWIVEQLFVGNRLSRGEAMLEPGCPIDLKAIRSPIIVFASHGDNITPPQQALNWIVDTYADEHEIKVRGQRILYMVHDKVGHLGIFVSSSIAKKEHAEMASTLKTMETLPPGLYEMLIDDQTGEGLDAHFVISFHERGMQDILAITKADRADERDFAAVARLSEMGVDAYETLLRPWVQASVTPALAQATMQAHPSRVSRRALSSQNPALSCVDGLAQQVRDTRQVVAADNVMLGFERLMADAISQSFDFLRDVRDASYEATFIGMYGGPFMRWVGRTHGAQRTQKDAGQLRYLPEIQATLMRIEQGSYASAVVRMLVLVAHSAGAVRRDRLERSARMLSDEEPFASLSAEHRAALIREQSLIVQFEPEQAIATLPMLLPSEKERQRAMDTVQWVLGIPQDMREGARNMLARLVDLLGVTPSSAPARVREDHPRNAWSMANRWPKRRPPPHPGHGRPRVLALPRRQPSVKARLLPSAVNCTLCKPTFLAAALATIDARVDDESRLCDRGLRSIMRLS